MDASTSDSNVADTGAPDAAGPDGATDASRGDLLCYADFPCEVLGLKFSCGTDHSYVTVASHDCHSVCGPGPCSGGTCDTSGPEMQCPASTVCVDWVQGAGLPQMDPRTTPCEDADAQPADGSPGDAADSSSGDAADGASDASADAPNDVSSDGSSD